MNGTVTGLALAGLLAAAALHAETTPPPGSTDARIRSVVYRSDEVYQLKGLVGYQIDIEFAPEEHFVGLAAGDIDGLGFEAQANHLFIKPKAARLATNLTVLTDRRSYHLDYHAEARATAGAAPIYAVRFRYPEEEARALAAATAMRAEQGGIDAAFAEDGVPRNHDYAYCGPKSLRPDAAWDDARQTHLAFGTRAEIPAVFLRNEDGSESLVNVTVREKDLVIHRIARQFILRRGRLVGCVVNRAYTGAAERADSGTMTPRVERTVPAAQP